MGSRMSGNEKILRPIRAQNLAEPELVTIASNFRFIISPLMDYILRLEEAHPGRKVAGSAAGVGGAALVGECAA